MKIKSLMHIFYTRRLRVDLQRRTCYFLLVKLRLLLDKLIRDLDGIDIDFIYLFILYASQSSNYNNSTKRNIMSLASSRKRLSP